MCVRLLDMLSPPGWLRIKDVPIRHHTWIYFPLGHLHTHFPAQITVRLIVRQDQGESNLGAPQPVELNVRVPLDSTLHEVIHRALADQSYGRLGSFRQQVRCTLNLPSRTRTHRQGSPIPHDTTLREVVDGAVGHIEPPVESYGHGPVPQTVRHYAIATSPTITLWIPNWALGHVGLVGLEQHLTPQPRQLRRPGRQGSATHASEPRQSLTSEHLAPLPEHWNLSLTTDPDSTQQDKIRQLVIIILDAEDLGFSVDSLSSRTEPERVLHVSFLATLGTKVSELIAATSHECQRRGIHAAFELNGARYTLG